MCKDFHLGPFIPSLHPFHLAKNFEEVGKTIMVVHHVFCYVREPSWGDPFQSQKVSQTNNIIKRVWKGKIMR